MPSVPNRLIGVDGYTLHRADRPATSGLAKGHGGVAILAKRCHDVSVVPTPVTTSRARSNLEVLWTKVGVRRRRQLLFAAVYRHPTNTRQQVDADLDDFEMQLQHFLAQYPGATVVVAGDFNLCIKKQETHLGAQLTQILSNYDFHLANTTFATYRPAGTLLDIIATNRPDAVTRRGVTKCHYGTPHDFTRIALRHVSATVRRGAVTETRPISRIDDAEFNWSLLTSDWSDLHLADTPEGKWAAFLAVFTSLLDRAAPRRRVRLPPPGAPRITDETRDLLARRRALLGPGHSRADYKEVNRQCRAAIRRDHAAYFSDQLREAGPARMWTVLRPIIGSGKSASAAPPACTPDALNEYYVRVGPTTSASVPVPQTALRCSFRV